MAITGDRSKGRAHVSNELLTRLHTVFAERFAKEIRLLDGIPPLVEILGMRHESDVAGLDLEANLAFCTASAQACRQLRVMHAYVG